MSLINRESLMKELGIAMDCSACEHNVTQFCIWKPNVVDICEAITTAPTIEPEPKWKRLMMHLADLQLTYSPNWGANGCGDQKLYEFVTGLIDELQGWEEGGQE